MKKIAVLTSGGDASGMNAAIRAIVRAGMEQGYEVWGVKNGYQGLIDENFIRLDRRSVGGILQFGGTILGSSRCQRMQTAEGPGEAIQTLKKKSIEALIIIGGNGTQAGAEALSRQGFPVVGIASTIDNDLFGCEISLGVDTALNIALEAIDRLKVTASAHHRASLVEVMGRDCGYLALMAGIAGGAEVVVIPEMDTDAATIARQLRAAYEMGKNHALVVVAEGSEFNAKTLAEYFKKNSEQIGFELRVTVLGHVQRGGVPGLFDRLLATRCGVAAVQKIGAGEFGILLGLQGGQIAATPLSEVVKSRKNLDPELFRLAKILAT